MFVCFLILGLFYFKLSDYIDLKEFLFKILIIICVHMCACVVDMAHM